MANIEYKTFEEKNLIIPFNPHRASIEKIEEYEKEVFYNILHCENEIESIIKLDHGYDYFEESNDYDEISAYDHFYKIREKVWDSSPFDKKILYNNDVTAVDEVKLEDFKYEENFRKCLNVYYEWLWSIYARKYCIVINSKKIKEMLINSPVDRQILINEIVKNIPSHYYPPEDYFKEGVNEYNTIIFNEIYDGNPDNYPKYAIITFYIGSHAFKFSRVKSIINDIEQSLL